MPTTSPAPSLSLKKKVIVSIPASGVNCRAQLRIFHDIHTNKGSISLKIKAKLANREDEPQDLALSIHPNIVENCALSMTNDDGSCPPPVVPMLPSLLRENAISTLSLTLNTTGIVLCPDGMKSISPADSNDTDFYGFAKISQSKSLRLHFSNRQFREGELKQLKKFSLALDSKSLGAESFRQTLSVVERDWTIFSLSPDPPPYEEPALEQTRQVELPLYSEESGPEQVIGKRYRDQWRLPSDDNKRQKRLLLSTPQPLDSATEVATPSTRSQSPASIRPTYFTRALSPGRTSRNKLRRLENDLRGISDDQVREALIRTGHGHLLARPEEVHGNLPFISEKAAFPTVERTECPFKHYIDEMIKRSLAPVANEVIDSVVSDGRDQISDECKLNAAEFREQVDDGNSEVRMTAHECMKEIQEQAQQYMDDLEEQAQRCMSDIDNRRIEVEMSLGGIVARFKRWFADSAPSFLGGKSSTLHELGTHTRRESI